MEEEINQCEIFVLNCLNYKLDYFTPYSYLNIFSLNGILFTDDFFKENHSLQPYKNRAKIDQITVDKVYQNCKDIHNALLEEELFFRIPCIYTAFCIITLARQIEKIHSRYPFYFELCYKVKFSDFASYYETIKK